MFGILKKKFSQLVESISKKTKETEVKEEPKKEIVEQPKEAIETVPEKVEIVEEKIEEVEKEAIKEEIIEEIKDEKIELPKEKEIEKIVEEVVELEKVKEPPKEAIEEIKQPEIEKERAKEEKKSWITRIKEKIVKTVVEKRLTEDDLNPILMNLSGDLIEADVSYEVAEKIKSDLRNSLVEKEIRRGKEKEVVFEALRNSLLDILTVPKLDIEEIVKKSKLENRPAVILFFGMNGVGKSLNISKLAKLLKDRGHKPILAAGDTYRAAGDIQLEMYAEKINTPVIKHQRGADSCAVIFDARKAAEARGHDVVLGDTSGRMHTKKDLMDELVKIVRVNKPDLKILVLDSLSGSDVVQQFKFFDEIVKVDAVIFSKVDVNEKGGNILSICHSFKRPILFLGVGQEFDNIIEYSPESFLNTLLSM
jgi:fused signal recognition particle receptor